MLHGRVVHPKTLGSTLVSVGTLDKKRYPNAQLVVKGNLVGVVAPTEWEAIGAAQQIAADTKWTEWKGLPGSATASRAGCATGRLEDDAGHLRARSRGRRGARRSHVRPRSSVRDATSCRS